MQLSRISQAGVFAAISLAIVARGAATRDGHTWRLNSGWEAVGWQKGPRVVGDRVIRMSLGMSAPEAGVEAAIASLQAVSDPHSSKFGRYMLAENITNMFTPPAEQVQETVQWLGQGGISTSAIQFSPEHGSVSFNITVARAEKLLGATYFEFSRAGTVALITEALYLPPQVSSHIDLVFPGVELPATGLVSLPALSGRTPPLKRDSTYTRRAGDGVDCFKHMSPTCVRSLYNMAGININGTSHPANSLGIFQPAWCTWLAEDLDEFFLRYQPELVGQRPQVLPINGGYLQRDYQIMPFNLESNLDHEYAMALAHPLPVTNIQVGDQFLLGNLNTMLAAFDENYCKTGLDPTVDPIYPDTVNPGGYNSSDCGVYDPPLVISVSYGGAEAAFSERYARRQCLEYLKLGLRGVSVIVSSGDYGTAQLLNTCINPTTGEAIANSSHGHFAPTFPASCPWVTAVGGTQLTPTNATWSGGTSWDAFPPETAFERADATLNYSSAGGFSRIFDIPFYQFGAVADYLKKSEHRDHLANLSAAGYFNARGRGFPDVSAIASNVIVRSNGAFYLVGGTSASAPIFASMIAKINDARLTAGKGPVGFLNPVLYGVGRKAMKDIVTGWNGGCGIDKAFGATSGWDAVTGLGSPNFAKLLETYMALP